MRKIKILLNSFVIIFIIIIALFYFQFQKSNEFIASNLIKLNSKQLEYTSYLMEDRFKGIMLDAIELSQDNDVSDYASHNMENENILDLLQRKKRIQSKLETQTFNNVSVETMAIYFHDKEELLTTRSFNINLFFEKNYFEEWLAETSGQGWVVQQGQLYFYFNSQLLQKEHEFTVAIKISDAYLSESIKSLGSSLEMHSFILLPNQEIYQSKFALDATVLNAMPPVTNQRNQQVHSSKVILNQQTHMIFQRYLPSSKITLVSYVPVQKIMLSAQFISRFAYTSIIVILILGIIFTRRYYYDIIKQLQTLLVSFKRVENRDFKTRIQVANNHDFQYIFVQFNQMMAEIEYLLESVQIEQTLKMQAQYKQLAAQINPHFLYNSLFYIISCADNPQSVREMAQYLAEYYQFKTSHAEEVSVSTEMIFAKNYLSIMKLRKNIDFIINVDEQVEETLIIPLLIQPLIENAIEHGIEKREGAHLVRVDVLAVNKGIEIMVSDDGDAALLEQTALLNYIKNGEYFDSTVGVALWNVNRRLLNRYGKTAQLQFIKNELGGLSVKFVIRKG